MSRRAMLFIALGVIAAHAVLFWFFGRMRALPEKPREKLPGFIAREKAFVDEETGEKMIYREFTVSTKLRNLSEPTPPPTRQPIPTATP